MEQAAASRPATLPFLNQPLGLVDLPGICELLRVSRSSAERLIKNDPRLPAPAIAQREKKAREIASGLAVMAYNSRADNPGPFDCQNSASSCGPDEHLTSLPSPRAAATTHRQQR